MSSIAPPKEIFRQYDIRGIAGEVLNEVLAESLGAAFGSELVERGGRRVALGHDCRLSSPMLYEAFARGLERCGLHILCLGEVPTPLTSFAISELDCDGAAMVTGSHNPPRWNGFKLALSSGPFYGKEIQGLRERIIGSDFSESNVKSHREEVELIPRWAEKWASTLQFSTHRLKVVVDAGNGVAGPAALALYALLPIDVIPLFCEPNGHFPNHHPDPTREENLSALRDAVHTEGADLGISFDGDGDRIGIIDRRGEIIWGDQLLLFFAEQLLKVHPKAKIIGEVKCSQLLYDGVAAAGGEAEMWKVGHSLIKARMKETGALIAGEMSGHIFFADRFPGYDDAAYVGARLFEILSDPAIDLSAWLDALPTQFNTPELRVFCPDEAKVSVIERASAFFSSRYEVNEIDGVRIRFQSGWGLIRASNTQPVLVLRFEAGSEAALGEARAEVERWLRVEAPEVDLDRDPDH
ncbi:MAG: phosphomannomutase/phosphoglucomutase [Myxococcota bacterium]|nr:phosphomannomutase/phosphoglucomutase [Myxococcota bacterium]